MSDFLNSQTSRFLWIGPNPFPSLLVCLAANEAIGHPSLVQAKRKTTAKRKPIDPKPTGPFRTKIARLLFARKTPEEKAAYKARANADAKAKDAEFEAATAAWPPSTPHARQRAIDNLGPALELLLGGLADLTGMRPLLCLGGPESRFRGSLQVLYYTLGENRAPVPVSFPEWDAPHFNTEILDKMKAYLKTAYTPQECAAMALPENECVGGSRPGAGDKPSLQLDGLLRMSTEPHAAADQTDDEERTDAESSGEEVERRGKKKKATARAAKAKKATGKDAAKKGKESGASSSSSSKHKTKKSAKTAEEPGPSSSKSKKTKKTSTEDTSADESEPQPRPKRKAAPAKAVEPGAKKRRVGTSDESPEDAMDVDEPSARL
uniref:Uncharacterized protein n=1 Tax=Mycena chlorophos TaxID=658473 RepID=A0ABQ0KUZ0_MYCCL|nr:predicted protein [Mycena chlorophos]